MIFGDRKQFALEIEPLIPTWQSRVASELGLWARLAFYVEGHCLTRLVEEGSDRVSDFINVPLIPLAKWFTQNIRAIAYEETSAIFRSDVNLQEAISRWNDSPPDTGIGEIAWEDARYEWYARHFWLAGADGSMLPDCAFVRADDRLWVSWRPPEFPGPRQISFIDNQGMATANWKIAWEALNLFVSYVATEARRSGTIDSFQANDAAPLETAIKCDVKDYIQLVAPNATALADSLGIAPENDPENFASIQAIRDLIVIEKTFAENHNALQALEAAQQPQEEMFHRLVNYRQLLATARNARTPEGGGYDAAIGLRNHLGMDGNPVDDETLQKTIKHVATIAEIDEGTGKNHCVSGVSLDKQAGIVLILNDRTRQPWAKRMEMARALGHLLLDPFTGHSVLGAGSSQNTQGPRRRRSGTFAAEFLLPYNGVNRILQGQDPCEGTRFQNLMEHFGVGARTAAYHLYNRGTIRSPDDRDGLIERYGAQYPS